MRAHSTADAIGQTFTSYFDDLSSDDDYYDDFVASEWVVTDRINAQTGRNFSSWAEYFGPRRLDDSLFTLTQQYNLSSDVFNGYNLGADFPSHVFNTSAPKREPPWRAEDIIIVSQSHPSTNDFANDHTAYRWLMLVYVFPLCGHDDQAAWSAHRSSRRSTRARPNASSWWLSRHRRLFK